MTGYNPTTFADRLRESTGARPGRDAPRWPGAPPQHRTDDGTVTNGVADCRACGDASTLTYRCSECGANLVGGST